MATTSDNVIEVAIRANLADLKNGMQEAQDVVRNSAGASGDAARKMGQEFESAGALTKRSMHEAKAEIALLGEETGVKIPRHLRSFVAELPGVGMALKAAFSATAVLMLIQILVEAGKKVYEFVESLHQLNEEEKKAFSEYANELKAAQAHERTILGLERERILVGKSEVEQAQLKAKWSRDDAESAKGQLEYTRARYEKAKQIIELFESGAQKQIGTKTQNMGHGEVVDMPIMAPAVSNDQVKSAQATVQVLEEAWGTGLQKLLDETDEANEKENLSNAKAGEAESKARKATAEKVSKLIAEAHKELKKQYDDTNNEIVNVTLFRAEQELKAEEKTNQQIIEDYDKKAEAIHKATEAELVALEAEVQHAKDVQTYKRTLIDDEAKQGIISQSEKLKRLHQSLDDEFKAEKAALERKLELLKNDPTMNPKEFERVKAEIRKVDDKYRLDSLKQLQQERDAHLKFFRDIGAAIQGAFRSSLQGVLQGTKSVGAAVQDMMASVALSIAEMLLEMGLKWLGTHVAMKAISRIFHIQEAADTAASESSQAATIMTTNAGKIASDAAVAAANAYAAYAWNPPLAAAMSAASYSAVMAMTPLAFFEQGGNVAYDMPAFLHRKEMVLPADLAEHVRNSVGNDKRAATQVSLTMPVQAIDSQSFEGAIERHATTLVRVLKKKLKGLRLG